jgi:hypothetical protein
LENRFHYLRKDFGMTYVQTPTQLHSYTPDLGIYQMKGTKQNLKNRQYLDPTMLNISYCKWPRSALTVTRPSLELCHEDI